MGDATDALEKALKELTRPEGEWFTAKAPEVIVDYSKELEFYLIQPLVDAGYSRLEALLVVIVHRMSQMDFDLKGSDSDD